MCAFPDFYLRYVFYRNKRVENLRVSTSNLSTELFKKGFCTELKKVLHHDTLLVHSQVNSFRILPKFLSSPNHPKIKEKEEKFYFE